MSEYRIELHHLPIWLILKRNFFVFFILFIQTALPTSIYAVMYTHGTLKRLSPWLLAAHITMLLCMYALFYIHFVKNIERHTSEVRDLEQPSGKSLKHSE